uniref:Ig-like domain-containing protein n=1 Tax=Sus scrofa TaxID=9823 RepID=A0A8D1VXM4_PIG
MLLRLLLLICAPLCEPTVLFVTVSPSPPIEGNSMTLACNTWTPPQTLDPPPQKLEVQRQFCFYKDGLALGLGWDSLPELRIPTVWREDSGSYWCEAKMTSLKVIRSPRVQINVHSIPISKVSLEIQPPDGHLMVGEKLVLACSVTGGTGEITFFWYKGSLGLKLDMKTQLSLKAKFEIPAVRESDSEQYYCAAENGYGPRLSELVNITVRIPVSRPVLILRAPKPDALVGDVVELFCEAQRGSPPILYHFYHENVSLGSSSAPFGGGVSFNHSLMAEHSGNYSCEANNGQGAQRSAVVTLNITVPTEDRKEPLTSGVIGVLLGILSPTAIAPLFCCWLKRKRGRLSARDPPRSPPRPAPQQTTYINSQALKQLQPVYENVNVVSGDEVYSLVYCTQQERPATAEEPSGTNIEDKDSSAIYYRLMADLTDVDYEDAM